MINDTCKYSNGHEEIVVCRNVVLSKRGRNTELNEVEMEGGKRISKLSVKTKGMFITRNKVRNDSKLKHFRFVGVSIKSNKCHEDCNGYV